MDSQLVTVVLQRLYLILLGGIAYFALGRARQYWRLRAFKGPRTTGISWLWHSRAVLSGAAETWYGEATEKYGPLIRVAPNHLITSSPEYWAHINGARSTYKRSEWYYHAARFEPGKDNVFTECDSEKHDARRKKMASGYAGKENPTLEPSIDTHVQELVTLIRKYAASAAATKPNSAMDLATKIQYFTLDVISHLALGSSFGDLIADADINDYIKACAIGLHIGNVSFGLGIGWLRDIPVIGPAISPSERDPAGFGKMMAEARKLVDARKLKSTQEKSDMIASFIRNGVTDDDLFQEVFEQLIAGSDTTAASIRIIMLYVMSHPRVYKKLQAEIDDAVKAGVAPASPGVIPDVEARKLPYLCAVIREGMRVHPPVVNIFSRVTPPEGDAVTIEGREYFVPGGTLVGYSAWSMHRTNKAVYGDDAEVFRPERWFVDESVPGGKERLAQMYKVNDMIFGYGRWVCLGRPVALIELHKSIFELFRHFDFALTNPFKPWNLYNSLGLWEIQNMYVDVTER